MVHIADRAMFQSRSDLQIWATLFRAKLAHAFPGTLKVNIVRARGVALARLRPGLRHRPVRLLSCGR
eukprot:14925916-Alexandrium_andersonii.AAC.1